MTDLLDVISDIGTALGGVAAGFAVAVAWWQLRKLSTQTADIAKQTGEIAKQTTLNVLTVVLEMESQLNSRKQKVDEVIHEIKMLPFQGHEQSKLEGICLEKVSHQNSAIENWFNALDRLSFCILNYRELLPSRDWKKEYRKYLENAIEKFPDFFKTGSPYKNMIDLYNLWSRELEPGDSLIAHS